MNSVSLLHHILFGDLIVIFNTIQNSANDDTSDATNLSPAF